jgi:ATP-dependent DNA ligase
MNCEYVEVAPKVECKDIQHLEEMYQDIVDKGGEGIILRDPNLPYETGRSKGFLKHKVYTLFIVVIKTLSLFSFHYRNIGTQKLKSLAQLALTNGNAFCKFTLFSFFYFWIAFCFSLFC